MNKFLTVYTPLLVTALYTITAIATAYDKKYAMAGVWACYAAANVFMILASQQ